MTGVATVTLCRVMEKRIKILSCSLHTLLTSFVREKGEVERRWEGQRERERERAVKKDKRKRKIPMDPRMPTHN